MPDTLFLLRLEHRNLGTLLGLLEDQVAAADAGRALDLELLGLAWEYFSDYPDLCHHPKEDLVYELLGRRDPQSCAGLRDLVADHARLHQLTLAFGEALRRVRADPCAAAPAAREAIREFAQRYRQHLHDEEERFFPLAQKRLSHADWQSLYFAMFERPDPLYDSAAEQGFLALRLRIEALAGKGTRHAAPPVPGSQLRELTGIQGFNDLMQSAGSAYRLERLAAGGYVLNHQGERQLEIPECSPGRAAWCAYCFVHGRGWPGKRRATARQRG